ncbi:TCR/Tet family MFS transporter [Caulobacter segnis]|uniref:TCR/Tet family MFS transporter n=1 Tax=Caulobacter segnis TaxID=88688 RepID=UPI00240FF81B|nr:TCR/Tet family MFS transporter [Caulobacter segnis]MDG2521720.1 TCR/Tet family MFS transporter [Caulobacter segnis]
MTEQTVSRGRHKAALGFIFATALMDVLSLGIMIPVLPNLVKEMAGGDTASASLWTGLFATVWALMQFFCSPILGMLSDRFGRRPVILVSIFGLGVDYLFMAMAPTLTLLFIGRIIHGITAASFATAGAYIADVTPPEKRAQSFGLIGAAWGVGFTIGPAMGGILGDIDLRLPFYVAAALALTNWLYGFFVLPESLPPEKRIKTFDWRKANPIGSLKLLRSHGDLTGLAFVSGFFQLAHHVLPSIFVLYTGYRYGWSPRDVGFMLMATGVANIIVQALLVGRVVKAAGERGALLIGLLSMTVGFVIYALAPTQELYWVGLPIFALSGLIQPGLMGLMSRRVQSWEQGQLQGANSSIMGITGLFGPALYTSVFAWSVHRDSVLHMPGLAVLIAGALTGAAFLTALKVAKPAPAEPEAAPAA